MKKLLQKASRALAVALFGVAVFVPAAALAQSGGQRSNGILQDSLCSGANLTTSNAGDCASDPGAADTALQNTINVVIKYFSIIVGVIAVIMIIVGGFKYITSGGDSGKVTGAKNTILYAIIGLILVALAQIIVTFVIGKSINTVQG